MVNVFFSKRNHLNFFNNFARILIHGNIEEAKVQNILPLFKKEQKADVEVDVSNYFSIPKDDSLLNEVMLSSTLREAEEKGCILFLFSRPPSQQDAELLITTIKKLKRHYPRRIVVGHNHCLSEDIQYDIKSYNIYVPILNVVEASRIALRVAVKNEYFKYKYSIN